MGRAFALLGLSAMLLVAWMASLPGWAAATVQGPCTAFIDGVDVTAGHDSPDTAVPLQSGSQVPVTGRAEDRVITLSYTVHVAGGGVQVGNVIIAEDGLTWAGTVNLDEFSTATVGLFEVTAEVDTQGADCTGVAYVCVEGRSPLTTVAGAGATALGAGGGILLALSLVRGGGLGATRSAVQGFAGGATAGLGGAVLLQQFCTLPLTAASAAGIPIAIGTAGAVGASLMRRTGTRGVRRLARRVPAHPGGEPTQAIQRGEELGHVVDAGAGSRELAGAGHGVSGSGGASGPSAASGGSGGGGAGGGDGGSSGVGSTGGGPGVGGGSSAPAGGGPGGGGGSAPAAGTSSAGGGPAPSGPGGGGGPGGPAPSGPGGAGAPGGPTPSGPGGAGAPGGPAPSGPSGGAPGGPAPSGPGGGGVPAPEVPPTGAPVPDTGMVLPAIPPAPNDDRDCPNCGAENSRDSQFCTSCGTRLGT